MSKQNRSQANRARANMETRPVMAFYSHYVCALLPTLSNLRYQSFEKSPFHLSKQRWLSLHNPPRQDDCVPVAIQPPLVRPEPGQVPLALPRSTRASLPRPPETPRSRNSRFLGAHWTEAWEQLVRIARGCTPYWAKVLQIRMSDGRSHNATTPPPRARHSCAAFARATLGGGYR